MPVDLSRSIEELEEDRWGPPGYDSCLVTSIHRIRKVPLRDLKTEDLRITLGQGFSVPLLLPLALAVLEEDPLACGDLYEGDLLQSVLSLEPERLADVPDLVPRIVAVAEAAQPIAEDQSLREAISAFLARHAA